MGQTAIDWVRCELGAKVAAIDAAADMTTPASLAREIDRLKRQANDYGLFTAVAVAQGAARALANGAQGPLVHAWLGVLRQSLDCDDTRHSETLLAAAARISG